MNAAATQMELGSVESEVLTVLQNCNHDLLTSDLVNRVQGAFPSSTATEIKRAIWNLIAMRRIRLSADQLLSVVRQDGESAA